MKDREVQQMAALEIAAQDAAEQRLEFAHATLHDEDEAEQSFEEYGQELSAPFCGCITCEVREVLHAAYPFMKQLALLEAKAEAS